MILYWNVFEHFKIINNPTKSLVYTLKNSVNLGYQEIIVLLRVLFEAL